MSEKVCITNRNNQHIKPSKRILN